MQGTVLLGTCEEKEEDSIEMILNKKTIQSVYNFNGIVSTKTVTLTLLIQQMNKKVLQFYK
jgi:hypothetical protein